MKLRTIHRSWPERLAMTAVFVANGTAFGAWAGNIPRLKAEAGLDDGPLGIVLLCVSFGAVGAMQVAGRYGARIGTARASWLSALVLAAALPLPAVAPGWLGLLGAGALLGLGLGLLDVCMNAHASVIERRWGSAIMSSFHAGWSLGQLLGATSAGLLAGAGLFTALLVPAVVLAVLGLAAVVLPESRGAGGARGWLSRPTREVVVLGAMIALCFAVEGGTADWSGVFLLTVREVPAPLASTSLAVFAGAMIVMRLVGDRLVQRLGPVRVVVWGAVVAAFGLLLALFVPSLLWIWVGFALVGAGIANIVPVIFSAAGRLGPAGVSIVATAGYGAVMATPPLIGFVSQWAGLQVALMLLVAGAGALAGLGRHLGEQLD